MKTFLTVSALVQAREGGAEFTTALGPTYAGRIFCAECEKNVVKRLQKFLHAQCIYTHKFLAKTPWLWEFIGFKLYFLVFENRSSPSVLFIFSVILNGTK